MGPRYLVFTAGLSLDLNQFVRYKGESLTFGGLSFLFPAALAYGALRRGATKNPVFTVNMAETTVRDATASNKEDGYAPELGLGWRCTTRTHRLWSAPRRYSTPCS